MRRQAAQDLRAAIDDLPLATREAMLQGVQTHPIIVGADGNLSGGVCPIFASSLRPSRQVGRPFARAWDRYARARLPRPASERELLTLRSMLETSIQMDTRPPVSLGEAIASHEAVKAHGQRAIERRRTKADPQISLSDAIAEHKAAQARTISEQLEAADSARDRDGKSDARERDQVRESSGEHDRTTELSDRPGWAWLRPVRSYDEYERALRLLEDAERRGRSAGEADEDAERPLAGVAADRG